MGEQKQSIDNGGKGSGAAIGTTIGIVSWLGSCVAWAPTPGVTPALLWGILPLFFLSPIIGGVAGFVAGKIFKDIAMDNIKGKMNKENDALARLLELKKK